MAFEWRELWCKDTVDETIVASCFADGRGQTYLQWLLSAWGWTLAVSAIALVIALVLGSLMGVLRTGRSKPLAWLGEGWTELFRNLPLIVQLFLWFFVLAEFFAPLKALPSYLLAALGLGLFTSARISEQVKAGIQAIPSGQRAAGLALGFKPWQVYRFVLLPVAFRIVIPPLTSEAMSLVKNSSVAFALSVLELTQFARQVGEETSRPTEVYAIVTLLYFVTAFSVYLLASLIERWVRVPGVAGGGQMNLDYGFVDAEFLRAFIQKGFLFSIQLTLVAMVGGIVLGTVLALMRLSSQCWISAPAAAYVNLLRSVPLVMVILWFYLLVPRLTGPISAELSAFITFTLFEAAYYAEIMRAGVQSVPKGQSHAAFALGMSYRQSMALVVLPQAFRNMLPVLLTQTIILFQDTSLVYAIGAYDLLKGFEVAGRNFNRPVETYLMAAAVYFTICLSLSMLVRRLQKRIAIIR